MKWHEVNSIYLRLFEEIETARYGKRRRVRVQVFFRVALWVFLGGLVTLFAGWTYQAFVLWSVVPFLLLYPLIREVFFGGKDGFFAVLSTVIVEEWFKSQLGTLISNRHKKR